MADSWYYVQKGNRHGPVALEVIHPEIVAETGRTGPRGLAHEAGGDGAAVG